MCFKTIVLTKFVLVEFALAYVVESKLVLGLKLVVFKLKTMVPFKNIFFNRKYIGASFKMKLPLTL